MKFTGQTKDGVMDNLLRAYVSRPSNPRQACPEFDPDRTNAYIERSLTGASRSQYEQHLSICAACRKYVVALVRLAEADTFAAASPAREIARSTWFSRTRQVFGAMSQPQWAIAAAAVIVLAISLPLVLSRSWNRQSTPAFADQAANAPQTAVAPASSVASPPSEVADRFPSAPTPAKPRERSAESADEKTEALATNSQAAAKPADAAGIAGADLAKKQETRTAGQLVDELQAKPEGKVSQAPAQAGAGPASQVAKNDSDQARQQQPESERARNEPKDARADQESIEKEKTRRGEEAAAPPSPSAEVSRDRAGLRRSAPKLSLREPGTGEAVRVEERKISGRRFLFRDGAWTDKDFDPNKDLPIVTIIRDSNVYKELLSKRSGLRSIMERFTSAERAIIVYKGTVYKLIPQQGDK